MNILVVSSLLQGATAIYLIEALKAQGARIQVVSDIAHPLADELQYGVFDVSRWTSGRAVNIDALLFVEGGTRRLFPVGMERLDCRTAWWAIDTHVHTELHVATARLFDTTFVVQHEFLGEFAGCNAHWLPLAADPALFAGAAQRDLDVAYVGSDNRSAYPERARLLDTLRARYPNSYLGRARPEEMGAIYGRAKVVFNKSVRNDVNMRYFEAMCAGAVLVTDRLKENGVDLLFQPGSEIVQYDDEASLVSAIDRLLADEARRAAIGARARDRVLQHHTYEHRARKVLEVLSTTSHAVRPTPDQYLPVFHLLRFPDGVLRAAASSLQALRDAGDRNAVLAVVATICTMLAWLLVRTYRMRFRLRHWRLGRHADGR